MPDYWVIHLPILVVTLNAREGLLTRVVMLSLHPYVIQEFHGHCHSICSEGSVDYVC